MERQLLLTGQVMASIQLILTNASKAAALRALLLRSTQFAVECTQKPHPEDACVVVADVNTLPKVLARSQHPERIVLIARSNPANLKDAWDAGVNTVVSEDDPLNTVVLAILSACLRKGQAPEPAVTAKGRFLQ
jgi:AmiR/NasT family two-component response regulator